MTEPVQRASAKRPETNDGRWLALPSQAIVLVVIVSAPWFYGSVHEAVQFWLLMGVAAALGWHVLVRLLRHQHCVAENLPIAIWPLMLALLLGVAQLIPLPDRVTEILSPQAVQLREELLPHEDSPDAALDQQLGEFSIPDRQTISLRPQSTRQDLALLVLAIAVFYLGTQLFRRRRAQFWLFLLITVNGTALAFFGLIQKLTWNGQLFWIGAEPGGGFPFASFVNRNNAGGYLNLCVAVAIGLTIWTSSQQGSAETSQRKSDLFTSRTRQFIAQLDPRRLAAFCMLILLVGGVICTFSRGAGIALLGAGVITALAMSLIPRRRRQVGWFAVAAIAGFGLVGWVGMYEGLQSRLATLSEQEALIEEGRVPNWQDAAQSIPEFWRTGVGFGGYRDAYLMYQHRRAPMWYYRAENQYLEAIVDGGVIGLLLMLIMIGLVGFACLRLLRSGDRSSRSRGEDNEAAQRSRGHETIAIVTVFALSSQVIHGAFDFGLYLPPNMALLAVLCGAVTGVAADRKDSGSDCRKNRLLSQAVSSGIGLILLVAVILAAREKHAYGVAAAALAETDYSSQPGTSNETEVSAGIGQLTLLAHSYPDHAELHYQLAKLHILSYRLKELDRLRAETDATVSLDQLWDQTSPQALHLRAHQLAKADDPNVLARWRESSEIQLHLITALKHLLIARRSAPLLSKCHLRIAGLSVLADDVDNDEIHVTRACRVNPSSAYTLYEAGLLDLHANRTESACNHWQLCLTYAPEYLDDILADAESRMNFQDVASDILPQSPDFLLDVVQNRFVAVAEEDRRTILFKQIKTLIKQSDLAESDKAALRGRMLNLGGDTTMAIREYVKAVQQQPNNASWRFELARLLQAKGMAIEALKQAEHCIRLEPENTNYQRLHDSLIREIN